MDDLRDRLYEGMSVFGADRRKLGRLARLDPGGFVIEKGFVFLDDYIASYGSIQEVHDSYIVIGLTADELQPLVAASAPPGVIGSSADKLAAADEAAELRRAREDTVAPDSSTR